MTAEQAPELPEVLAEGQEADWEYACLDGTLIETTQFEREVGCGT